VAGWDVWLTERKRNLPKVVEAHIIVSMAGAEAEHVLLGYWHEGRTDRYDREKVLKLAKTVRWPGGWRGARKRLQQRTHELVEQNRDAIRRVALALLKHRKLDYAALSSLLRNDSD
jgi:uncharacterized membrane protein